MQNQRAVWRLRSRLHLTRTVESPIPGVVIIHLARVTHDIAIVIEMVLVCASGWARVTHRGEAAQSLEFDVQQVTHPEANV